MKTGVIKKQIGIRIPQELDKQLEKLVNKIGISKPAFILNLIYRELERCSDKNRHIPIAQNNRSEHQSDI